MPITIVAGGQFGSEGKGKVAYFLAKKQNAKYVIRCGGTNSGHTVVNSNGTVNIFRQLPTASILPETKLVLCAGSYIDLEVLHQEINAAHLSEDRILINPNAIIITEENKVEENKSRLIENIGSTGSGTGSAVAKRALRSNNVLLAKNVDSLKPYVCDTTEILCNALKKKERVLIEGTQGFGLSLYHTPYFPYCTSRDTTAAGFLAEAGLSPLDVDDVALVLRAFPIRVAGNSGPLPQETTWDIVTQESKAKKKIIELTTVTKKVRRVARFDADIVNKAIKYNNPTKIFLNHVDYFHNDITEESLFLVKEQINSLQKSIKRNIDYIGISPQLVIKYN